VRWRSLLEGLAFFRYGNHARAWAANSCTTCKNLLITGRGGLLLPIDCRMVRRARFLLEHSPCRAGEAPPRLFGDRGDDFPEGGGLRKTGPPDNPPTCTCLFGFIRSSPRGILVSANCVFFSQEVRYTRGGKFPLFRRPRKNSFFPPFFRRSKKRMANSAFAEVHTFAQQAWTTALQFLQWKS